IDLYAYLCYDGDRISSEISTYQRKLFKDKEKFDPDGYKYNSIARFVLLFNHNYETSEILQNYDQGQQFEQIFDLAKNAAFFFPSHVHTEEELRAHLLVSFIESVLLLLLDKRLKKVKLDSKYELVQ
ncbi:MAG: hypothetical protein LBF22_06715, partial [Deltaproteobacteria bacterium]|nr:hypothetical protein [Deltaproteobacteria bacterium]